jgi:hypothetical protein
MTFIIAGGVLLLALLVGILFDDREVGGEEHDFRTPPPGSGR